MHPVDWGLTTAPGKTSCQGGHARNEFPRYQPDSSPPSPAEAGRDLPEYREAPFFETDFRRANHTIIASPTVRLPITPRLRQ